MSSVTFWDYGAPGKRMMTEKERELLDFLREYVSTKKRQLEARKAKHKKEWGRVSREVWPGDNAIPFMHKLVARVEELDK